MPQLLFRYCNSTFVAVLSVLTLLLVPPANSTTFFAMVLGTFLAVPSVLILLLVPGASTTFFAMVV